MKKIFFFWLVCTFGANAQEYHQFKGQVLDLTTQQPLMGANIRVGTIGTSTNEKGEFLLKVSRKLVGSKLTVSMIGYKNHVQSLALADTVVKVINLESSNLTLDEVKVYSSASSIVKSAIERIEDNYFTKPTLLKGFCREVCQDPVKQEYIYLAEAVEDIYKPSYASSSKGNVYIIQARKKEFSPLDSMTIKFAAGTFAALIFDVVHTRSAYINEKTIDDYTYKLQDITEFDNQDVYVISFSPKNVEKAGCDGKLYINTKDESIIGVDFSSNKFSLEKSSKSGPSGTTFFKKETKVRYQKIENKYFLQSVSNEMVLDRLDKKKKLGNYRVLLEYTTTDIEYENVEKVKDIPKAHRSDIFVKVVGTMDENFWGNYTTVLQNASLQSQLDKLSKESFEKPPEKKDK